MEPQHVLNKQGNRAQCGPAAAASYQDAAHTPDKGNDGNESTMWIAANGDPGNWWMVDLGEAYQITGGSISLWLSPKSTIHH